MAARKAPLPLDVVDEALVSDVERAVRSSGALLSTKLTKAKLSARALAELTEKLVSRGLERGPKHLRVPLSAQLLGLLEAGARVPLKQAPKRVRGAAAKEVAAAIDELLRKGKAHVAVRTSVEVLVGAEEGVLDKAEIARLVRAQAEVAKIAKKLSTAKKGAPPRTLLREDAAVLLEPLVALMTKPPSAWELVDGALDDLRDPVLDLVSIPSLVERLSGQLTVREIHEALSRASADGRVELRPETGIERLSPEDAARCPPGPRGTLLSMVRRLDERAGTA